MTPWILDQAAAATSEHVGGKARALAAAVCRCLDSSRRIRGGLHGQPEGTSVELEPCVGVAIDAALATLCPEGVPDRRASSAAEEDGVRHSFADSWTASWTSRATTFARASLTCGARHLAIARVCIAANVA